MFRDYLIAEITRKTQTWLKLDEAEIPHLQARLINIPFDYNGEDIPRYIYFDMPNPPCDGWHENEKCPKGTIDQDCPSHCALAYTAEIVCALNWSTITINEGPEPCSTAAYWVATKE
jgi:hypothetical protein